MDARNRGIAAIVVLTVAFSIVLMAPATASAQCAMCRRALDSPEGRQLIAAFRSGILFLLVAPFAVFGTVAGLAVKMSRRSRDSAVSPPA